MCPEMIEQEHTPTWQNSCQPVWSWAFKRQWGKTELILLINLLAFHTVRDFIWAQTYTRLCIFVLKWKALQHSPQPATGASFIQHPQKQSAIPRGKPPTLIRSGNDWWIWPLPPDLHVWQPDLYRLPLISTFPHVLAAALGASSSLADYLADMGYISWLYCPMSPPLLTATKWRRRKYVPGKLYYLG